MPLLTPVVFYTLLSLGVLLLLAAAYAEDRASIYGDVYGTTHDADDFDRHVRYTDIRNLSFVLGIMALGVLCLLMVVSVVVGVL